MGRQRADPGAELTSRPGRSREVALAVLDFLDVEAPDFVELAAEAGFDAVTLRVAGSTTPVAADLSRASARLSDTVRALAVTGVGVLDVEVLRLSPQLTKDEIRAAVDLGAQLGARHLLVVNSAHDNAGAVDQLGLICELADGSGVRPCLEFMPFSRCPTLAAALDVVTAVDAGAGVLVDALHLHRSGGSVAELAAAVRLHGPTMFPYVQLCDAPATAPGGDPELLREEAVSARMLPGAGDLQLCDLLAGLPPHTPVAVEAPTAGSSSLDPRARAIRARDAARSVLGH